MAPNVVRTEDYVNGKYLRSGSDKIYKGQIVCVYHGEHITHREWETRLKSYRYKERDSAGNYMHVFFYRQANKKKLCVDATRTPLPMPSRQENNLW